jgi:hypothetical protein
MNEDDKENRPVGERRYKMDDDILQDWEKDDDVGEEDVVVEGQSQMKSCLLCCLHWWDMNHLLLIPWTLTILKVIILCRRGGPFIVFEI